VPTSVLLWTRLITDPGAEQAFSTLPLSVRWEVAEEEQFTLMVATGTATAVPELAHGLHVDVNGLRSNRWYRYRFMLDDAVSPSARTRTAPSANVMPSSLRFAFAFCQHWEFGHYAAHRHIAAANPDLVAFLGNYIYEWGPYDLAYPHDADALPRTVRAIQIRPASAGGASCGAMDLDLG
jgi:alkaline phosphatase D